MSSQSNDSPVEKRKHPVIRLLSLLAMAIGLPVLALFLLTDVSFLMKIWDLSRLAGQEPTLSTKVIGIFSTHVALPLLWCSLAFVGMTLDSRRMLQVIARAFLGVSMLWVLGLAVMLVRA